MAVTAVCGCGKRTVLGDVMAGRTIRCGQCGRDVTVPGGAAKPAAGGKGGPVAKGSPAAGKAKAAGPAVAVSPTLVIGGGIGAVVLAAALALYFGPVAGGQRVGRHAAPGRHGGDRRGHVRHAGPPEPRPGR